jgi:hypothetical protein
MRTCEGKEHSYLYLTMGRRYWYEVGDAAEYMHGKFLSVFWVHHGSLF